MKKTPPGTVSIPEREPRMPDSSHHLMIATALFLDVLKIGAYMLPYIGFVTGPLVGALTTTIYFFTFFVWYQVRNVKWWQGFIGKKLSRRYGTAILLRMLPMAVLRAAPLPTYTIDVFMKNIVVRAGDKLVKEGIVTWEELDEIGEELATGNYKEVLQNVAKRKAKEAAEQKGREFQRRIARSRPAQQLERLQNAQVYVKDRAKEFQGIRETVEKDTESVKELHKKGDIQGIIQLARDRGAALKASSANA